MTTHTFGGYEIPVELIRKTGAGAETFDVLAAAHMAQLDRFAPVDEADRVLEIGCGIGRDAIPLSERLSAAGSYLGLDIDRESIRWCRDNITARHRHFRFQHLDIRNSLYNPTGKLKTSDVRLSAEDRSIDRIIAQSVFTHLLADETRHYLTEFARVLRPDGLVLATFFIGSEEEIRRSVDNHVPYFRFPYPHGDGCYINDLQHPEAAVAYSLERLGDLLQESGMELCGEVQFGYWIARDRAGDHGQDIVVLKSIAP